MERKIHILILADPLDDQSAGVHRYVHQFLHAMDQRDTPFRISIIRSSSKKEFQNIETVVIPSGKGRMSKALRIFYQIPRTAARISADIVIEMAHFGPFNLPKGIKRGVFIHDLTPLIFPQYHIWISSQLQKMFLPRIARQASVIFCNSTHTKKDIHQHLKVNQKVSVLKPGLDPDFYFDRTPFSESLEALNGQDYVLSVGTLEPRKNLEVLITAFEQLKEEEWQGVLVLCGGKGWKDEALLDRIERSPFRKFIRLTGFVSKEDLRRLYSHSSVFVYPSLYEGFGLPVLEALSCSAKVIASRSSSLPEAGGEVAVYFDPTSPKDLKVKISNVLEAPKDIQAIERHVGQYNWSETAEQFLKDIVQVFEKEGR